MVSGQATQPDTQADCPFYDQPFYDQLSGSVDTSGNLLFNRNYGQLASARGPYAAPGSNGCVYPSNVPTLFNQLDTAGVSWKGYAHDLGNTDASGPAHSAGVAYCGAPYSTPGPTGSTAQPNPGSANATDQYVPKHFPFPWFDSLLSAGDCNAGPTGRASRLDRSLRSPTVTPHRRPLLPGDSPQPPDPQTAPTSPPHRLVGLGRSRISPKRSGPTTTTPARAGTNPPVRQDTRRGSDTRRRRSTQPECRCRVAPNRCWFRTIHEHCGLPQPRSGPPRHRAAVPRPTRPRPSTPDSTPASAGGPDRGH